MEKSGRFPKAIYVEFEPAGAVVGEAFDLWCRDDELSIDTLASLPTAAALSERPAPYLTIVSINAVENATKLAKFATTLKPEIDRKRTMLVIFTTIQNPKFQMVLRKLGQLEIIRSTTKPKSLKLKLSAAMKLLTNLNVPTETIKDQISEPPAIECNDDCWILLKSQDIKRIRNLWMVEILGPGPSKGKWIKENPATDDLESTWIWTPTSTEKDPFVPEGGTWSFFGKKPEFHKQKWSFVSPSPLLKYVSKDGQTTINRIQGSAKQQRIEVLKNCRAAVQKLPIIKDSLMADMRKGASQTSDGEAELQLVAQNQRQISDDLMLFEGSEFKPNSGLEFFKKLTDPVAIRAFFKEGAKEAARVTIWTANQEQKYDLTLYLPEGADDSFFLQHENVSKVADLARFRAGGAEPLYFHLATRKGTIFFMQKMADLVLHNGQAVKSAIPPVVFELEGADKIRVKPKNRAYLSVTSQWSFEVRDISYVDVSAYVTKDLYESFERGSRYPAGSLKVDGKTYPVELVMTWKQNINESDWVVGFSFNALPVEAKKVVETLTDILLPAAAA